MTVPASVDSALPPHDIEAEEAVLGSLLLDEEAIDRIASFLAPDDFFRERNAWTFEACLALRERDVALSTITVADELSRRGRLEGAGGTSWLIQLIANVPSALYVEDFGRVVRRKAQLRRLIEAAARMTRLAYQDAPDTHGDGEADGVLAQAEEMLFALRQSGRERDFTPVEAVVTDWWNRRSNPQNEYSTRPEFIATGFVDLDQILMGGFRRSDLVILAARPSVGKTSFALNIATHAALRGTNNRHARVAVFSLEMSRLQLVKRMLASLSGVDAERMERESVGDRENQLLADAAGELSSAEIYIDDSATVRIADMRAKLRRLHGQYPVDLVVVDYLQLIQGSGRNENRVNEVGEISRGLKAMARELDVPVIALSQLSRSIEQRPNRTPQLSDLRDSGSIEQDADVVIFLSRDDKNFSEEEWKTQVAFKGDREGEPYPRGIVDVIVAKHRNGPIDRCKVRFFENTTRFGNLERRRVDPRT